MHIFILLVVSLTNFWIWRIFQNNIVLGVVLILLSFLLFKVVLSFRFTKKTAILIIVLTLIVSFFNIKDGFDRSIFQKSPDEILLQDKRHGVLSANLGKIFTNKLILNYYSRLSLPLSKLEENAFSAYDLNLYFFSSHPRERKGIDEFEKYSFALLPLFILGLFKVLKEKRFAILYYILFATLITSFISSYYKLGPILFFPIINILITFGIVSFLNYLKNQTH